MIFIISLVWWLILLIFHLPRYLLFGIPLFILLIASLSLLLDHPRFASDISILGYQLLIITTFYKINDVKN